MSLTSVTGSPDDFKSEPSPRDPNLDESRLSTELMESLQSQVREIERARGTANESIAQKCLLLTEEVFEVLKIIRVRAGVATSKLPRHALSDELADIIFVSTAIANRLPHSAEGPFRAAITEIRSQVPDAVHYAVTSRSDRRIIDAAVDLASSVVGMVKILAELDEEDPQSISRDLENVLVEMLRAIERIAGLTRISLEHAINLKIGRDQFRLWQ